MAHQLYRMAPTLPVLLAIENLELASPPRLTFANRRAMADALEQNLPEAWTPDRVWFPPEHDFLPPPRIVSTDKNFAPDFFMLGFEFLSARLRAIMPAAKGVRYVEIDAAGSSEAFLRQDYRLAVFPSLTPFAQVFIDAYFAASPSDTFKPPIRDGFAPPTPVFTVATGPWLMCTRDVLDRVMGNAVSGVAFFDYETDEERIPTA